MSMRQPLRQRPTTDDTTTPGIASHQSNGAGGWAFVVIAIDIIVSAHFVFESVRTAAAAAATATLRRVRPAAMHI